MLEAIKHQDEAIPYLSNLVRGRTSPLLLLGPEGVGKKHAALQVVREIFCLEQKALNCQCAACYQVEMGIHPDLTMVTVTKTVISVDDVRLMVQNATIYPTMSDRRCFIITDADKFSQEGANAFLKTLEEPPARSLFILLAENLDRVLPTIISRCGVVRFNPLPEEFIVSFLAKMEPDDTKALVYARMGEGSVGRAVQHCAAGRLALRDQALKALKASAERDFLQSYSLVDNMSQDTVMTLKFIEQALHDVLIAPLYPMRVISQDSLPALLELGSVVTMQKWGQCAKNVDALFHLPAGLILSFHLKTALTTAFI